VIILKDIFLALALVPVFVFLLIKLGIDTLLAKLKKERKSK